MATKTVRRIVTAGVAGSAAIVLAAAPAGASSPISSTGSDTGVSTGVEHGTAVRSSQYTFTVVTAKCVDRTNEQVVIKQVEHGKSGVTHFKQGYQAQYLTTGGWRVTGSKVYTSNTFPNNNTSYYFKQGVKYTYGSTAPASHRIVWIGQWLGAGNRVIASASRTFLCR